MGKGPTSPELPEYEAPPNNKMEFRMMELMMASMMANNASSSAPTLPELPDPPEVGEYEAVDWEKRMNEIATKARGDATVRASKRRGRSSTNVTGPLTWGEEPSTTTESILTGK